MIGEFVIYVLATWRIASLLATEGGPLGMFSNLRRELGVTYDDEGKPHGSNVIARAITCVWCMSLWIAVPFVVFGRGLPELTVYLAKARVLSYQGTTIVLTLALIAGKTAFYVALPLAISAGAVIVNGVVEWHEQARPRS